MTCLELDSVLLQNGVFSQSVECASAVEKFSTVCCYTPPTKPCNLCQAGQQLYSIKEQTVTYNGAETNCFGIHNFLSTRVEVASQTCVATQVDLFDTCCYDKCRLCQDYHLDIEAVVVHEGTSMGCSEIENSLFAIDQITQESEECLSTHKQHFEKCCYDVPCDLCTSGDSKYELLITDRIMYKGKNRTCGDVSVLLEAEMSQSDVCKAQKDDLFDTCCFEQCNLCSDPGWAVDWNHPLTYDGLASTCIDVFMNLRNERVKSGDDRCVSVQQAVSHDCCYKMPMNQCSLCQSSNGTYLNTNWNYEVTYQGESVTCSDVNAKLSSEELDGLLCLTTRDELWDKCCVPHEGGNIGLAGILPIMPPEVSDQDNNGGAPTGYEDGGGLGTFFRRNEAQNSRPSHILLTMLPLVGIALFIITA